MSVFPTGFKLKDDKLSQNLFNNSDPKQGETRNERPNENRDLVNTPMTKNQDDLKLRENISNSEMNSCVLPNDMNGSCVNTLSDTDLSDFICEDDDDDEDPVETIDNGNNNDSKAYRLNGSWKNETKVKSGEIDKLSSQQQQEKIYELSEMFEDDGNDDDCSESNNWKEISNGKVEDKNSKSKEPYKLVNFFNCKLISIQ